MQRKVFSVGNSKGVSIPAEYLTRLDLAVGSEVNVIIDEEKERILIEPVRKRKTPKGVDRKPRNESGRGKTTHDSTKFAFV